MKIKNNSVDALTARPKATEKPFLVAVKARDGPYMTISRLNPVKSMYWFQKITLTITNV